MTRRNFMQRTLAASSLAAAAGGPVLASAVPQGQRLVVLTFDDAVKSHLTVAAPLLKELGFGATFFVTHFWMGDTDNFMTWEDIAELHGMGFEIGNHTWTHDSFASPRTAARLEGNLSLVEYQLDKVGVPNPVSFAFPGNQIGPEAVEVIARHGFKFGRRGMAPEIDYEFGVEEIGPAFNPAKHHRLLIPSAGIPDPTWTLERLVGTAERANEHEIVVLQFHGVPDMAHPWVYVSEENFRAFMAYLKEQHFRCIALRELENYVDVGDRPDDPVLRARIPPRSGNQNALPAEVAATQADLDYWLGNMIRGHGYTWSEAAQVAGLQESEVRQKANLITSADSNRTAGAKTKTKLLPYPGGRHPRIGFLEGAYDPIRGTKASVFLPWDHKSFVVVDLPEAIHSNIGMLFLAHTHIPTLWDEQNKVLENVDWHRESADKLTLRRLLPNGILFGASIEAVENGAVMELWLRNVTYTDLTNLRGQVCVMFKGAAGFNSQTNDNKTFGKSAVAARSNEGNRWIITAWQHTSRTVANPQVPCMHADPYLPDCPAGHTVRTRGRLWFYEGDRISSELEKLDLVG